MYDWVVLSVYDWVVLSVYDWVVLSVNSRAGVKEVVQFR